MAASGYTPILLYASGTATNVPLAANMTSSASGAELGLNYADGKLYYKNSAGVVTLLASATTVTNSFSAGTTGLTPNTATTGAVTLAGTLAVANGGTGLSSGTSGGVLAYTATGTLASSTALAASALVIGGGAGAAPSTTTTGTGVVTALGVNTGTAGAFVVNGGALGSPSSAGTIPAFTLGGTVAGAGNQINNVVIGTSTPLAGAFTTVTASTAIGTASGGTGLGGATPFTSGGVVYASSSSALATGSALTFDGATLTNGGNIVALGGDFSGQGSAGYVQLRAGASDSNTLIIRGTSAGSRQEFVVAGSERMRIDTSGNLLVGQASQSFSGKVCITFPSDTFAGVATTTSAVTTQIHYRFANGNGVVGSITTLSSATLFNTTSDQRLKENIFDAPEFGSVIDSIKVRSFDWKTDNTHQRAGFVAQELVTVAPEAVHQSANEEDMMAVDYSKLVPMLVKEIQSLRKRLTALESKEIS